MDHHAAARVLLAVLCGFQGIATAIIDLGPTHATHPGWIGHARFHVVWQSANAAILSAVEIGLLLVHGPAMTQRFYLAASMASAPMLSFFVAQLSRRLYGGTLSDPQGMPPAIVTVRGRQWRIDLNVVAEIVGLLSLATIVALHRAA